MSGACEVLGFATPRRLYPWCVSSEAGSRVRRRGAKRQTTAMVRCARESCDFGGARGRRSFHPSLRRTTLRDSSPAHDTDPRRIRRSVSETQGALPDSLFCPPLKSLAIHVPRCESDSHMPARRDSTRYPRRSNCERHDTSRATCAI